jgi:uncharacterized damage-inducible protein DinB
MTLDDLRTLLDYHYWARDRMLDAAAPLGPGQLTKDLGNSFKSILDTMNHLYFAEWAWHERWNGRSPAGPPVASFASVAALRTAWANLETDVRGFLESLGSDGVSRVFEYTLLSGQSGASMFWQMLQHVVNHGSYHRGQVTTMLRQLGAPPARPMDLIAFYRTK